MWYRVYTWFVITTIQLHTMSRNNVMSLCTRHNYLYWTVLTILTMVIIVQYTLYASLHCILVNVQCTVYAVHCIQYNKMYIIQYTIYIWERLSHKHGLILWIVILEDSLKKVFTKHMCNKRVDRNQVFKFFLWITRVHECNSFCMAYNYILCI